MLRNTWVISIFKYMILILEIIKTRFRFSEFHKNIQLKTYTSDGYCIITASYAAESYTCPRKEVELCNFHSST